MSKSEMIDINTESTESLDIPEDTSTLLKLYDVNRNVQTDSSQGFYSRLANSSKNLYQTHYLLNKEQFILLLGALLGGYLTMNNLSPEYRFDKSPTISIPDEIESWNDLRNEIYNTELLLDDQPNYSHNSTIILAQRIGFPTTFEL